MRYWPPTLAGISTEPARAEDKSWQFAVENPLQLSGLLVAGFAFSGYFWTLRGSAVVIGLDGGFFDAHT